MGYLNREAAPFEPALWEALDTEAVTAARDLLTARRFLTVDGPYGIGLTSIEVGVDDFCRQPNPNEAGAVLGRAISVPMLRKGFALSIRRVQSHITMGQPLSLIPVGDAAEAVARREEEFVYYGQQEFGVPGLLTAQGRHELVHGNWTQVDQALGDVLNAVNELDASGFHGPYAIALSPALYNELFRRYEGTDMLQLEHLGRLCQLGVFKAGIDGGVVVDPRVGRIIVGQDLAAGYADQDGIHYRCYLTESVVLMVEEPEAICTLKGGE